MHAVVDRRGSRNWGIGGSDNGRGTRLINRLNIIPTSESHQSIVVVCLRVGIEIEIRVQLDDGVSVSLDFSVHRSASRNRNRELADASRNIEGLGRRRAGGQGHLGRGSCHNDGVNSVLHELVALGFSNRVGRSDGIPGVRPSPHVDLVLRDLGERSGLEGVGVVGGHIQPGGVVEPVNPGLAIRLVTLDGTDVVGLAVVVPGDNLNDVDLIAVADDRLPALVIQMVVRHVDPLETKVRESDGKFLRGYAHSY